MGWVQGLACSRRGGLLLQGTVNLGGSPSRHGKFCMLSVPDDHSPLNK
jgi:hypothetical protein